MAQGRGAALAPWLALSMLLACAGPSADIIDPPDGTPPPQQPEQPPEQPPPPQTPPPAPPPPAPTTPNPQPIGPGARILFIGNSLTEVNDVPALVRALSTAAGLDWVVEAQTIGGAALEDHWNRSTIVSRIGNGNWDVVVMQQGPSALPESRVNLRQWAARFDGVIKPAGGRSALYMVWPMRENFSDYDRVRDSYALAARGVAGYFLPAGESWRAAWRELPTLPLYGPDGFHPTLAGSYAAALTIFAGLSGRSPVGLPAPPSLDTEMTARLQRAAQQAIDTYRDYQPPNVP